MTCSSLALAPGFLATMQIETADGLRNLDDIIESQFTDAVLVARGNLGMEIACEKIALAQANIVTKSKVRWMR